MKPPSGASWHTLTVEAVCSLLATSPAGLSAAEARERLASLGPNELHSARKISPWGLFLQQFKNILIIILLVAVFLSALMGHAAEAISIAILVLLAALLGFVQEFRAERAIEALRQMAAPVAAVLREGEEIQLPARELVPGDLVLVKTGDRIPADLRLVEARNLQVDEAALTGESTVVEKTVEASPDPDQPLAERSCLAYAGTAVTGGRGRGVVVATGMGTEFGRIAGMLTAIEVARTPLQQNLDRLGRVLAKAALIGVAIIVVAGIAGGKPVLEMLLFGIALAVAVVPEALPAVVTISLALGVKRMAARHALMRRLAAVETLGSTTVICSDKTGTLTRDEMTARRCFVPWRSFEVSGTGYDPRGSFLSEGEETPPTPELRRLLETAALACDARLVRGPEGRFTLQGDPTEGALIVAAAKGGLEKGALDLRYPRVDEIPFSSDSKRMTTLHSGEQSVFACAKGAPEVILGGCAFFQAEEGELPLDPPARERILEASRQMAGDALRVLAVAFKRDTGREEAEKGMTFLGLVGMIDPPRAEAGAAIGTCREAGIRPIMITGDHPLTALAVARELGLSRGGKAVTGAELEAMNEAQLEREVDAVEVYARVSPEHKLRLVQALQKRGEVVAMTGDGVNDAPALKKADIGIAMGITGTEVSREAAAMTLTDDNFASIVAAVEEGRIIFDNIKKYLMYLLSSNLGEIGIMAGAMILGLPLPLSAVQILYVNLATDGLPALALAVDPPDADIMRRPPRDRYSGVFTRPVVALIAAGGLWSTVVNLAVFAWARACGGGETVARTMTFATLVVIQLFNAYNFRSERRSSFARPFANRWLNLAVLSQALLLVAVLQLPLLRRALGISALTPAGWLLVLAAGASIVPVIELCKCLLRRGTFGGRR